MSKKTTYTDSVGNKFWYKDGKFHRDDGPAIEYANGNKYWYKDGLRHRDDGPAVEYADGTKYWYIYGNEYSEVEYGEYMISRAILREAIIGINK